MPIEVDIPGIGIAEFPDDMPDYEIARTIRSQFPELDPNRDKKAAVTAEVAVAQATGDRISQEANTPLPGGTWDQVKLATRGSVYSTIQSFQKTAQLALETMSKGPYIKPIRNALWRAGIAMEEKAGESGDVAQEMQVRRSMTGGSELVGDVASGVVSTVPTAVAAVSGFGPALTVGALQQFGSTFSQAEQSYLQQGASDEEAKVRAFGPAFASAATTALITKGFGATGIEAWTKAVASGTWKQVAKSILGDAGMEAGEEFYQQIADSVTQKLSYNPKLTWQEALTESAEAGLVGFLVAGGLKTAAQALPTLPDKLEEASAPLTAQVAEEQDLQPVIQPDIGDARTLETIGEPEPVTPVEQVAVEPVTTSPEETVEPVPQPTVEPVTEPSPTPTVDTDTLASQWFTDHHGTLMRQAMAKGVDPDSADQLATDAILKTSRTSAGKDISTPLKLLSANLNQQIADWADRKKADKRGGNTTTISIDEQPTDSTASRESITSDTTVVPPDVAAQRSEVAQAAQEAVSKLSTDEQAIWTGWVDQGKTFTELAKELNTSPSQIGRAVKAIKAKLQTELAGKGIDEASVETAQSISDFITDWQVGDEGAVSAGIPIVPVTTKTVDDTLALPGVISVESQDPDVEARWQAARGLTQKSWLDKLRAGVLSGWHAFTRHYIHLDSKTDGAEIDILRQFESVPQHSQAAAAHVLRGITAGLGPNKMNVFERLVILPDLLKDIDKGMHEGRDLPFGYADRAAVQADLDNFQTIASANPDIRLALDRRGNFMDVLRQELVLNELLPESVLDFEDYFHRQVMVYMAMRDEVTPGTSSKDVRLHGKGWQKKRVGSELDYNTRYIESEFEVISQSIAQIATQETLSRLDSAANIKQALRKIHGEDWAKHIPANFTVWQPKQGNLFYWGNTITDKALEDYLLGVRALEEEDFRKALVMGGPKNQWVIPKRLALTLDNFGRRGDTVIEKFMALGIGRWKIWTLLNPLRALVYNINNLSGDLDIVIAYRPKILTYAFQAARDLRKFRISGGAPTTELDNLMRKGVIGAGFSAHELPDLKKDRFFAALEGKDIGIIRRFWQATKDFTQWREDTLRVAAYRYFRDQLSAGKVLYGASKKSEIDKSPSQDDKAAKLARELIGDYGNVSVAGQWMREHMMPFYSWMEINAPRYVRLLQNVPHEGGSVGRLGWTAGMKVTTSTGRLAIKASIMYFMISLWNRVLFSDEEEEMGDMRGQLHIILGRNEDGSIRSFRFAGALSDALSWFGGENLPQDIREIREGKASGTDKMYDALAAPINKVVNASSPIKKTVVEAFLGLSTYPDVRSPRPIRDRAEHVAKLFSVGSVYNYLADKPTRDADLLRLVTYTTDPGEQAYYAARKIVADWADEQGKERPTVIPTKRSNVLYYYKQAVKFGDDRLAKKYLQKYNDMGGKDSGLEKSIAASHPLGNMSKADRKTFYQSLTPKEQKIMDRAVQWHLETYK